MQWIKQLLHRKQIGTSISSLLLFWNIYLIVFIIYIRTYFVKEQRWGIIGSVEQIFHGVLFTVIYSYEPSSLWRVLELKLVRLFLKKKNYIHDMKHFMQFVLLIVWILLIICSFILIYYNSMFMWLSYMFLSPHK